MLFIASKKSENPLLDFMYMPVSHVYVSLLIYIYMHLLRSWQPCIDVMSELCTVLQQHKHFEGSIFVLVCFPDNFPGTHIHSSVRKGEMRV